ncbi:MAG: hypothetical protein ACOYL5_13225 [Phototrophicaceae bacterium]|jgi:hypothetical protein
MPKKCFCICSTQYEPSALAFGRQKAVLERQISEQFKQATQRNEDT